mgnify:CR=1 FL=1
MFYEDVDKTVYYTLLKSVNKFLDLEYRFFKLKEKMLGLDKISVADMRINPLKEVDTKYTFEEGFDLVSGGTDNHSMLVDLRSKYPDLTGKVAEKALVEADITANKNMVPFDSRSAFQTSGLRFGTPAITTRGLKEDKMDYIAELIDRVLSDPENEANIAAVRKDVNAMMEQYPLFAW